jgi:hypothetical protein
MENEELTIIVRFWRDKQKNGVRLQVVNVDTAEEMLVSNSSFLLRFWVQDATVERCLIRHLSSGHQAYVQSGAGLQALIKACLLSDKQERPSSSEDRA